VTQLHTTFEYPLYYLILAKKLRMWTSDLGSIAYASCTVGSLRTRYSEVAALMNISVQRAYNWVMLYPDRRHVVPWQMHCGCLSAATRIIATRTL
jgi:hypothetical protein